MTLGNEPPDGELASEANSPPPGPSSRAARFGAWRARHRATKRARSRRRKWAVRSAYSIVALIAIVAGSVVGYSLYRLDQLNRVPIPNIVKASGPTENILMIGSTSRCAASALKTFANECAEGVNGVNSDVVLVMHLDPSTGQVSLLSIPRDTFVPDARADGAYGCADAFGCSNKIDAALADGPGQLVAAIERDYGIPINHFVELNFDTFENVVNALGGLHMYFGYRLVDDSSQLYVHHTGCLPFNGQEALELVRARHVYYFKKGQTPNIAAIHAATVNGTYYTPDSGGQYDGTGDLGRITRVHLFLKALAEAVRSRGFGNPLTDNALIGAVAPNLTVDSTFGDQELLGLALDFRQVDISNTPELTTPIIVDGATYYYMGYNYGDVVFPSEPEDQATIDQFLGTTPAGWKLAPSSIAVSVIDGTDSSGATAAVASRLGLLGYRVVPTTETHDVGPVSESMVEYAPGHLAQAQRVMASLAGAVVLAEGQPTPGAEVSVVAGSDLSVVPATLPAHATSTAALASPPAKASLTSATGSALVAATLAATSNPDLSPPTEANPKPAPWDPRSCKPKTK